MMHGQKNIKLYNINVKSVQSVGSHYIGLPKCTVEKT